MEATRKEKMEHRNLEINKMFVLTDFLSQAQNEDEQPTRSNVPHRGHLNPNMG